MSPQSGGLRYPGHYVRTGLGAGSLNKRFASDGYQQALLAQLLLIPFHVLRMQMCRNGTVKFSVNQIPATVYDGTNRCNVRASQLFGFRQFIIHILQKIPYNKPDAKE